MNKKHIILLLLLGFNTLVAFGQIEGEFIKPRGGKFLLQNGTIITVTQGIIKNSNLLITNGRIEAIGTDITDSEATVIDCSGLFIYPGMIDAGNRLGLVEVKSVDETLDHTEIGNVSPNMQALTAINPNSVAIP